MRRAALTLAALLAPGSAHACAVCGIGGDPNRASFFWSTVALSLLPLAMMGGGVFYLWRAARRLEASEAVAGPAPDVTHAPPTRG